MPSSSIARRELTVELEQGLHVVPCSQIVKEAMKFQGTIRVICGEICADAKSMFDLLGLNAVCGTTLTLEADGDGAEDALDRLVALFEGGFQIRR